MNCVLSWEAPSNCVIRTASSQSATAVLGTAGSRIYLLNDCPFLRLYLCVLLGSEGVKRLQQLRGIDRRSVVLGQKRGRKNRARETRSGES